MFTPPAITPISTAILWLKKSKIQKTKVRLKYSKDISKFLKDYRTCVTKVCICGTNSLLVSGELDGSIIVWNAFTTDKLRTLHFHKGQVTNLVLISRPLSLYGLTAPKARKTPQIQPFSK